jgi:hypothetical protein
MRRGTAHSEPERNPDMIAAPLILLFLFMLVGMLWLGEFLANDPAEEIRATKRHQFLGPGGPDDPFANDPFDG